jgi:glucose/arabinose dehydrogenase
MKTSLLSLSLLSVTLASACGDEPTPAVPGPCNGESGLQLPEGFCATVFADGLGRARHITVTPAGDVFVAVLDAADGGSGHVVALRDEDGDGVADRKERFSGRGGNGIAWRDNVLYFAQDDRILRYTLPDGALRPTDGAVVAVSGLPVNGDHDRKSVAIGDDGELFVNIGSASNACQVENRERQSPGIDPCPELDYRAGIWRFDADAIGQTLADGQRHATGIRNANALALDEDGALWAAQLGRDQLYDNWPLLYAPSADERLPSEEIFRVAEGADYGWPYCYHDAELDEKVLAPEYGGNGTVIGRCEAVEEPDAILPAHWSPLGMHFYQGSLFPARYLGGMFVANHGSRFAPQARNPPGYDVVFFPATDDGISQRYETFADGFAGDERPLPEAAVHRPVGLAEAPDGSLYISDDHGGRIWRVFYRGVR